MLLCARGLGTIFYHRVFSASSSASLIAVCSVDFPRQVERTFVQVTARLYVCSLDNLTQLVVHINRVDPCMMRRTRKFFSSAYKRGNT